MRLQLLTRWFASNDDHFYGLLERQALIACAASDALMAFVGEGASPREIAVRLHEVERDGDAVVREVEDSLLKTIVTPLDREDIRSLSARLHDIIDLTSAAACLCVSLGVDRPTESMARLFAILGASTHVLADATAMLRRHLYADLVISNRTLRALQKEGECVYRDSVSAAFCRSDRDVCEILREREVLADVGAAIKRCEMGGNALANLAAKHG